MDAAQAALALIQIINVIFGFAQAVAFGVVDAVGALALDAVVAAGAVLAPVNNAILADWLVPGRSYLSVHVILRGHNLAPCQPARLQHVKGKLVAASCHAGWVLVSAGILKGKNAPCFSAIKDDAVNAGAKFIDREVVVDENLITSRNPYDLPAFMRESIKFLRKGKG